MKKQCFGYVRVSTVKQGEGASLDAQKEAIERYTQANDIKVIEWLEEKETAAKQGRPVFNAMIKSLRAGKADGVVMHKIDRSARNFRDWATVGELQDEGIAVHFATENVDFGSRGGRLTADIQAVIAADYCRNLKEERTKGFNARLKQGLYPLKAPLGYLDTGGGNPKKICPNRGPLIVQLFERYATGQYSMAMLVDEMHMRGLRTKTGGKVYKSRIDLLLRDPFYIGLIKIKTTGYLGHGIHEPLIDARLFEKVQELRSGRTNRKKTKLDLVYRAKILCQGCGKNLIGEKQRGHIYYRCHTRECSTKTVREEVIERALIAVLTSQNLNSEDVAPLLATIAAHDAATGPQKQPTDRIKTAQLEQQNERLLDAYLKGMVDEKSYQEKKQELLVLETRIYESQKNAVSKRDKIQLRTRFLEHAKSLAATYFAANSSEKRQLLEILFSNISVSGRKPYVETKKWLLDATNLHPVLYCGLPQPTGRSGTELGSQAIEDYMEVLSCPDSQQLIALCDNIKRRQAATRLPESSTEDVYYQAT